MTWDKSSLLGEAKTQRREGGPGCLVFILFSGRIIAASSEEPCLCLWMCLKRETQTKPNRLRERERETEMDFEDSGETGASLETPFQQLQQCELLDRKTILT